MSSTGLSRCWSQNHSSFTWFLEQLSPYKAHRKIVCVVSLVHHTLYTYLVCCCKTEGVSGGPDTLCNWCHHGYGKICSFLKMAANCQDFEWWEWYLCSSEIRGLITLASYWQHLSRLKCPWLGLQLSTLLLKSSCHFQTSSGRSLKKRVVSSMWASNSYYLSCILWVQKPPDPLNVGMPLAAEMPAPVKNSILLYFIIWLTAYVIDTTLGSWAYSLPGILLTSKDYLLNGIW